MGYTPFAVLCTLLSSIAVAPTHAAPPPPPDAGIQTYSCTSTLPICQNDCLGATMTVCLLDLSRQQMVRQGNCEARFIPVTGAPLVTPGDCQKQFNQVLALSEPAAAKCNGVTTAKVGGVLGFDILGLRQDAPSYAVYPTNPNGNCLRGVHNHDEPITSADDLFGVVYDCPKIRSDGAVLDLNGVSNINFRDISPRGKATDCTLTGVVGAACATGCILGTLAT